MTTLAMPRGRWVTKPGGIRVWTGPRPTDPDNRPANNLTPERLTALFNKGWTDRQIADAYGLDPSSIRKRRSRLGLLRRTNKNARCGTDSGYKRHLRNNEPACTACKQAHREYGREYARRARNSKEVTR